MTDLPKVSIFDNTFAPLYQGIKDMDTLTQVNKKGVMENYPVDANTVEDAINYVETGDGLRTTNISMTDVYAIMEAMKHKKNEK